MDSSEKIIKRVINIKKTIVGKEPKGIGIPVPVKGEKCREQMKDTEESKEEEVRSKRKTNTERR